MSDEDSGEYLDTLANRRLPSTLVSNLCDNDGDADTLNSSTSTAGPPGFRRTGRYQNRPWETGSNTSCSSPSSATQQRYGRTGAFRNNGSYRSVYSNKQCSTGKRRSMSNASTVVSLIGSVPEWSRSFCLFNPWRAAAASRSSFHHANQALFAGKHIVPGPGGSLSSSITPGAAPIGLENHRRSVSFGVSQNHNVGPGGEGYAGRSTSTLFYTGHVSPSSVSTSPIIGGHRSGRQSMLWGTSTPTMTAFHAVGGAAWQLGKGVTGNISPARKELAMLLPSFCSYLSLVGKPVISGNADHPMDMRKGPLIGVGGFAKVYAGMDCVSGRLVAIKEINIAEINDQAALNAIGKEFGLLKSLRHPNIVSYQLFEHSASQKVCRIVMELLTGGSTLALLEKYGPLREPILRKFARHLLEAIAFIHKEGISHRDIKPANILVSDRGVVKLCDFGCSKRVNELSKSTNCVIGTPLYMSPEFIKGEFNPKSDIWSMACSLFELGTGLLPWHHAKVRDNLPLMFYITTTSETPLTNLPQDDVQEFSLEFKDFMEQCFIRDVKQRPDAADLLDHPWIKGARLSPAHNSFSVPFPGGANSPTWPLVTRPAEEELFCQYELEEVAAYISVDMCSAWMLKIGTGLPSILFSSQMHQQQQQQSQSQQHYLSLQTDIRSRSEEISPQQNPIEQRHLESQGAISGSQCHSPAVSSRGGGWVSVSPTVTVDAAQNDQFNYSIPLGASEGRFVLPSYSTSMMLPSAAQYLRINADGSLDFVPVDEETVEVDADVDDAFACSHEHFFNRSPSSNFAFRSSSPPGVAATVHAHEGHSRHCSPGNLNNNISHSAISAGRSPANRNARHGPAVYNQSMSLMSNSSFPSRGVSPSRRSQTASTASLTASQHLPTLLMMTGSISVFAGASMNHSSDDVSAEAQGGVPSSSTLSRFPDSIRDAGGRLHMSLSVPTGGSDRRVNIELSVDPEDVHCKYIERRPSYVVAFSEDIRAQLAAKMNELAPSSVSSPIESQWAWAGSSTSRCVSRGAQALSSQSFSPR
ncbi:protein kinase, putative,serine/threonine protein kinase, putative [Trypanosoma cruzi]|nr:protein kinase, putative,serine/threonine protein kinase, putative [Trypanosoma cruzi]